MTTIIRTDDHFPSIRVNNRYVCSANRIETIEQVSKGRWRGIADSQPFEIEGGRAAGGTKNDWFVTCLGMDAIYVKSAVAAVKIIELT